MPGRDSPPLAQWSAVVDSLHSTVLKGDCPYRACGAKIRSPVGLLIGLEGISKKR